ncbi:oxidoreductase nitrogenase component 1 [Clostridia bacterium]|nr:oxidoreductase nitrogenase component 1 [Clostridia bacterium]
MAKNRFIERPRSFCALGGALLTVEALPEVVPILHTAMGCGGSIYWNQYGSTGYLGAGYCGGLAVPSSNIGEQDIVFGGLDRLEEQVKSTVELVEGNLYVILTGCTADIIGDDVQAVVRQYREEGVAIIGAETGGFHGDGYRGYDIVLSALVRDYIKKQDTKKKNKVNLLGIVPGQDVFWRGNLLKLRELLEQLGLEVNSFFTEEDTLSGIQNAGDAALTIVASEFYGIGVAKELEEIHGIPYLTNPFPIGPAATTAFIRSVAKALGQDTTRVEEIVSKETKRYFHYVERFADAYNDQDWQRYAVVVGDANYAPALTKFLADDLGWVPKVCIISDDLEDFQKEKVTGIIESLETKLPVDVYYESDPTEVKTHFWKTVPRKSDSLFQDTFSPAFVVGSHLEREFAIDLGAGHLSVSYPVGNRLVLDRGYAGFSGSLSLIEDLIAVIVAQR